MRLNYRAFVRVFVLLTLSATAWTSAPSFAQLSAPGIAFITDVRGEATLDATKAGLMAELKKGNRLACLKTCEVGVMYLQSGKEFVLQGPGDFIVGEAEVAAKVGAPPKVRETSWKVTGKTVNALAQSTSSASIRMRSISGINSGATKSEAASPANGLLYPTQTNVASLQPQFSWVAKEKSAFDFELKTTTIPVKSVYRLKTNNNYLKLPQKIKLQADTEYVWMVKTSNAEIGASTFKTFSAASLEAMQLRKPTDKALFSDWLLYGLTLQELGASQDAAEVFAKLAKDRPDLPELAALAK